MIRRGSGAGSKSSLVGSGSKTSLLADAGSRSMSKDAGDAQLGALMVRSNRRRHTEGTQVRMQNSAAAVLGVPGPRNSSKASAAAPPALAELPEEPRPVQKEEKVKDKTDAIACQLALKHRLMLSEVKGIINELKKAQRTDTGGMKTDEFDKLMARIFDIPAINTTVSKSAYIACGAEKDIDIDKLLEWYVQNMFTAVNALTADAAMASSNNMIYNIASRHNVSNCKIDKIKSKFDRYDLDSSGKICYKEFESMFCSILGVTDTKDLNPERIKRFWSQVDKNNDGGIDFEEYVEWYLKYFAADNEADADDDMSGPLQKFYDGFNPIAQRHNDYVKHGSDE